MADNAPNTIPNGMTDEQAARFRTLQERRALAESARAIREQAASLPPSPDDILKAEEEEVQRIEREERDAAAWKDARAKHGKGRVALVPTPLGAIILRVQTLSEQDTYGARINALDDPAAKIVLSREATMNTVVYPSREEAIQITNTYPGLWVRLYDARDALSVGEADRVTGKA